MDLLFKRYASPFLFIDGMMGAGRFCEFVEGVICAVNSETKEQNREKEMRFHWELYLHRVLDRSFADYMREVEINDEHKNLSEKDIETTLRHSSDILNNFNPEREGE